VLLISRGKVGFGKYNPSSIIKNLARIKRKNLLVKIKENSKAVKEQNYFDKFMELFRRHFR